MAWCGRPRPSFRPALALCVAGATARILAIPGTRIPLDDVIGAGVYAIWVGIGVGAPLLAVAAWWAIQHRAGRLRYIGLWMRLCADIGLFTWVLSYHVTAVMTEPPIESPIPARYLLIAVMLWLCAAIASDLRTLVVTERKSRHV